MRIGRLTFTFTRKPDRCRTCGAWRTFLTRWEDTDTGETFWTCRAHAPAEADVLAEFLALVATGVRAGKR